MSEQSVPTIKPDDQPIDAGEVGELKDLPFHEAQHIKPRRRGRWPNG